MFIFVSSHRTLPFDKYVKQLTNNNSTLEMESLVQNQTVNDKSDELNLTKMATIDNQKFNTLMK